MLGTRSVSAARSQHHGRSDARCSITRGPRIAHRTIYGVPWGGIARASRKGDDQETSISRSLNGGKESCPADDTPDKQPHKTPSSSVTRSDDAEGSASAPAAASDGITELSTDKPRSARVPRPDAKKSAKHLSTFTKIAERAKNRARVRNGAKAEGPDVASESAPPKGSMPSSSLADVFLSASSKARSAASVDIPDARSPQSLLSALKRKKQSSLQNSKLSSFKSLEPAGSVTSSVSPSMKLPPSEFTKVQQALSARAASSSASFKQPSSGSSSRWGQVSSVLATGGSKELAAVEGGATFVHKARERFMDMDSSSFWALIRSVVPVEEWPQTATALARLQSITRVELSQQADVAAAALDLANSAKVLPPDDTVDSGNELSPMSSADIEDGSGAFPPFKPFPATTTDSNDSSEDTGSSSSELSTTSFDSKGASSTTVSEGDISSSAWTAAAGSVSPKAREMGGGGAAGLTEGDGLQLANFAKNVLQTVDLDDDNNAPTTPVPEKVLTASSDLAGAQFLTGSIHSTSSSSNAAAIGAPSGAGAPGGHSNDNELHSSSDRISDGIYRDGSMRGQQVGSSVSQIAARKTGKKVDVLGSREGQVGPTRAPLARNSGLGLQLQWFTLRAHNGPLTHSESMSLDLLLTQQLLALAGSAHFGGLKPRDVALAKSLNEDKLSQLFVKVDESTLDARLVSPHTHADLPSEARSLLVLKRGTGSETNQGLLLGEKLDYLQLLVVEAVSEAFGNAWDGIVATGNSIARAGAGAGAAAAAEAARVAEETGVQYPSEPFVDTKAWGQLKGRGKDAIIAMRECRMSPRMMGGGLLLTLSDLGLGAKVDVIRLPRFDAVWPAPDKRPVRIRRVTLEDVFKRPANAGEGLLKRLFKSATLEEPTFQELLVVYRRKTPGEPKWLERYQDIRIQWLRIVDSVLDSGVRAETALAERARSKHTAISREPVQLRVLSDIPMAYWQAVFPDKLVQFKPLDGLRLDFVTVVGIVAVLAQIKVDSPVLQVVSLLSLGAAVVRSVLGYRRMTMRYENFTNEMIASKTLAQEEAVIEFLARAAAQQRFASAALAYAALVRRAHRARTNIAAVAAAEAAAVVAADDAAASAARRAAEPLRKQPWLARHMLQPADSVLEAAEGRSMGGAAGAALSALLDEGQRLLEAVRSVAGASGESSGASGSRKRRGAWQGPGMTASELRLEVETMLEEQGLGHVRFDVNSALHELRRLQLLQTEDDAVRGWLRDAGIALAPNPEDEDEEAAERRQKGLEGSRTRAFERRYVPVSNTSAEDALTGYWTSLLEGSVETSLAGIL